MARYRIGNDMTILWTVNDRDGKALPLGDKEVHLYYTCEQGRFETDFEIQNTNVIVWNFLGRDQRTLGGYTLTLEILQSDGKRSIKKDICNAFVLVGKGCEERFNDADAIMNGGEITLVSDLDIYRISPIIPYVMPDENGINYWYVDGVNTGDRSTGESAYEYARKKGYAGSEEEFAAMLSVAPELSFKYGSYGVSCLATVALGSISASGEWEEIYRNASGRQAEFLFYRGRILYFDDQGVAEYDGQISFKKESTSIYIKTTYPPAKTTNVGIGSHIRAFPDEYIPDTIARVKELKDLSDAQPFAKGDGENSAVLRNGDNSAFGEYSTALGMNSQALDVAAHAEGEHTTANGGAAHAEGLNTQANKRASHAEGANTVAGYTGDANTLIEASASKGDFSHAEGNATAAAGDAAHAEGKKTLAANTASHSEGYNNISWGVAAHSEGQSTTAVGDRSHAEGYHTIAKGRDSHAEGVYTETNNQAEHASGKYNKSNTGEAAADRTIWSVGGGTSESDRRNLAEIREDGRFFIHGEDTDLKARLYGLDKVAKGKLSVFHGSIRVDSATDDGVYSFPSGISGSFYYANVMYSVPATDGESITIGSPPYRLTIDRVSRTEARISGTGVDYLSSMPLYMGSVAFIPKQMIPMDGQLSAESTNLLPNKVITEELGKKVDKKTGKGLSTEDFTTELKTKLVSLYNYDDTDVRNALEGIQTQIDTLVSGDASTAIDTFNEIIAFLNGVEDTQSLESIIASIEQQIAEVNRTAQYNSSYLRNTVEPSLGNLKAKDNEHDQALSALDTKVTENKTATDKAVSDLSTKVDEEVEALQTQLDSNGVLIEDLQESKADVSGYYPQLSVGQADNLPDRGDVVEGLLGFRESAGAGNSIEDGTANVQELLGESLVWNQVRGVANKTTVDTKWDVSFGVTLGSALIKIGGTFDGSAGDRNVYNQSYFPKVYSVVGHKYLCSIIGNKNTAMTIFGHGGSSIFDVKSNIIVTCTTAGNIYIVPQISDDVVAGTVIDETIMFLCIDLTQMFGAGNEPTTVEEFEARKNQLVGVDFTAYNAGEVLGVNIKGIKSVNDNAWDEEWELGSISNGSNSADSNRIRSKNYICVSPNTAYYITFPAGTSFNLTMYDADKQYVGVFAKSNPFSHTMPNNVHYVRFTIGSSSTPVTTYNHDICIRLAHSGYKTDYVAHEESESSFDLTPYFPDGMHGINGVRDSVTKSKATRRFGMVDLGSLNWRYQSAEANGVTYNYFISNALSSNIARPVYKQRARVVSSLYVATESFALVDRELPNKSCMVYHGEGFLYIRDDAYTDAATFKAAVQGVMLYYELATPIETEIDPQLNMNYKVWDFGTEELLTDSKSAPVLARTIYGFNATDTIRGNKAKNEEQDARIDALENEVVRVGDYQPDLSVGVADNLAGTDYTESEIGFRRSGGGAILDGNARVSSVKGNSVVWNQKFDAINTAMHPTHSGIVYTRDGYVFSADGTSTQTSISHSAESVQLIASHKYMVPIKTSEDYYVQVYDALNSITYNSIFTASYSANAILRLRVSEGITLTNYKFTLYLIDLTQMFGAGNEPTTIEEFYARKPKVADENAFNEGEVIHMEADAIKSVGVNQWDEEWEVGVFLDTGAVYAKEGYENAIHTKNYIPVIVGKQYYFNHPNNGVSYVCEYDANKNFIRRVTLNWEKAHTVPVGVSYVRFSTFSNYGTTYNHDICINLSDTEVNGKYFPYVKREQTLDMLKKYFPNGMKSAGTAHDEIRWNAQKQKWEAIKRIGEVDMGTLDWGYAPVSETYPYGYFIYTLLPKKLGAYNILCSKYSKKADYTKDNVIYGITSTHNVIVVDSDYTDATTFKAAMSGVILYYELAEPIVTEIDENFNLDYEVWNAGTEQMIADTPSTPVKASIAYGFNAVGKIKQLEEIIAQLRAKVGI